MSVDLLFNNISRYIHLDEAEKTILLNYLQPQNFKRKQYLLQEGEICRYSAFVKSGCLRGYTVDKNGVEHVLSFAPADWWMGDMYSLISQRPGILNIEAMEDTETICLSKTHQENYTQTFLSLSGSSASLPKNHWWLTSNGLLIT